MELVAEGELDLRADPLVRAGKVFGPPADDLPDVVHNVVVQPIGELLTHALVDCAVHLKFD